MIDPPRDCFEHTTVMAHRFGPARGNADNKLGPSRPLSAIGSPRATFHHGPEPERSTP